MDVELNQAFVNCLINVKYDILNEELGLKLAKICELNHQPFLVRLSFRRNRNLEFFIRLNEFVVFLTLEYNWHV